MEGRGKILGLMIPVQMVTSSVIRYKSGFGERPSWLIDITGFRMPMDIVHLKQMFSESKADIWLSSPEDMKNELNFYNYYSDELGGVLVWRFFDKGELRVYSIKLLDELSIDENLEVLHEAFWCSKARVVEYRERG